MSSKREKLYNGIELPQEWPPKYPMEIFQRKENPYPPYLVSPPDVIHIGVGRELFVDDFLIEKTTCKRSFHYPEKYSGNPILAPETPLELQPPSFAGPKSGGVWFDYQKKIYRMWYEASFLGPICYAESRDGLHWERPDLDVVPGTNRVLPYGLKADSWTVVYDYYTKKESERFKLFLQEACWLSRAMCMTSPDGIHWSRPVAAGYAGDRSTMFYNPFRKKWCFSLRAYGDQPFFRFRDYAEGDDFMADCQWGGVLGKDPETRAVHWACADSQDQPHPELGIEPQLYNLDAVPYESLMLGFFQIHYGPSNDVGEKTGIPKITELEFAYSRDGFHWLRPDRNCAIRSEFKDVWDRGYVQSLGNICTVDQEKLTFYYIGFQGKESTGIRTAMYSRGATGAAFLRRDGFASMDADSEGTILTRVLTFSGSHLFVNADAPDGRLTVEVLTPECEVIEGFSEAECCAVSENSTKCMIRWRNASLAALKDRKIRLRFHLKHASLYAFWISRSEKGESAGYLAGGSADYSGPVDL